MVWGVFQMFTFPSSCWRHRQGSRRETSRRRGARREAGHPEGFHLPEAMAQTPLKCP